MISPASATPTAAALSAGRLTPRIDHISLAEAIDGYEAAITPAIAQ